MNQNHCIDCDTVICKVSVRCLSCARRAEWRDPETRAKRVAAARRAQTRRYGNESPSNTSDVKTVQKPTLDIDEARRMSRAAYVRD